MRLAPVACAAALLLGPVQAAHAWGEEGHSIIAEIANRRLSAEAHKGVEALLGKGASLASVASWADDERVRDPRTTRWHFVDIPLAKEDYQPARDCVADSDKGDCIVAEIAREQAVVACATRPASDRKRSLMFLTHFVADIHQPMHTVKENNGGNGVKVTVVMRSGANGTASEDTNLHAVWDATLIRKTVWAWGSYVDVLESNWLSKAGNDLAGGTPADWALDSHRAAARIFEMQPRNDVLDDAYLAKARPILDRQLSVAGLRLAHLLNQAFAAKRCK
ncbi:S1/P1 nuclease [Bordetella genomosp. 13]|uniref:S1/P1 nuclease n=1 Tax=Bordetella genomosp. 13 TaxID=463040 RepID=UPI00119FE413|nr:S1/P1 nuclease [Bordetella genomosp. 13]